MQPNSGAPIFALFAGVSLLKLNDRKGALTSKGLLWNIGTGSYFSNSKPYVGLGFRV